MGKGLGIAALVILFISFPIPVIGTWIGYLALIIAAISALCGHKTLVIATTVIAAIKMYFLSPGLMATMYIPADGWPISPFLLLTTFFAALPMAMLLFRPAVTDILKQFGLFKGTPS